VDRPRGRRRRPGAPAGFPPTSRTRSAAAPAALLTLTATATAAQARRISMTMHSNFAFQNDPVGCNGRLPSGYDGQGEEIMQMSSPKPVLVQSIYAKGTTVQDTHSLRLRKKH
jgi:hypothetical protein